MKRKIKIETTYPDGGSKPKPMIRLKGKWLEAAGFPRGFNVEVTVIAPGCLQLAFNPPQLTAKDFHTMEGR
jgi:hypothetical protein